MVANFGSVLGGFEMAAPTISPMIDAASSTNKLMAKMYLGTLVPQSAKLDSKGFAFVSPRISSISNFVSQILV
jgi:hypothetical protein